MECVHFSYIIGLKKNGEEFGRILWVRSANDMRMGRWVWLRSVRLIGTLAREIWLKKYHSVNVWVNSYSCCYQQRKFCVQINGLGNSILMFFSYVCVSMANNYSKQMCNFDNANMKMFFYVKIKNIWY